MNKFQLYDLVVANHEPDAVLFRVCGVEGRNIGLIDAASKDAQPNQQIQWSLKSSWMRPTLAQLQAFEQRQQSPKQARAAKYNALGDLQSRLRSMFSPS